MERFASFDTFVTVYEAGLFSATARKLAVGNPPCPSRSRCSSCTWARLPPRSARGLVPTEAGHRFYVHARQAILLSNKRRAVHYLAVKNSVLGGR